jgi:hypothetical protein
MGPLNFYQNLYSKTTARRTLSDSLALSVTLPWALRAMIKTALVLNLCQALGNKIRELDNINGRAVVEIH